MAVFLGVFTYGLGEYLYQILGIIFMWSGAVTQTVIYTSENKIGNIVALENQCQIWIHLQCERIL